MVLKNEKLIIFKEGGFILYYICPVLLITQPSGMVLKNCVNNDSLKVIRFSSMSKHKLIANVFINLVTSPLISH